MLWLIIAILFVLWLFGYAVKFGGDLIHLLLVLVVVGVVYNLLFANQNKLR